MRHHIWIGAALLAAGCSDGGTGGPTFGLEQRTIVSGLTFPTGLPDPGPVDAVDAFPLLAFRSPMFLTHAGDGSDRVFVIERDGIVLVFDNDPATAVSSVFLDLRSQVRTGGERGMLGLAFDPAYAANGAFYVSYSTTGATPGQDHRTVVSRFQVSADPNAADPASETVLLSIDQPYSNHNGGMLAFGPDDQLYVSVGDGGSQDDPGQVAQDTTSLLGKILRVTRDGAVPPDNPLVGAGGGVREEIFAFGFRNPWRFSFDRGTGELWCGDVGQSSREEIDLVVAGGNYGWDVFEGSLNHENPGGIPLSSTVRPLYEYGHGLGRSITGGYVYRGSANPSLVGSYLYADFVTGRVWALVWDGQQAISNEQVGSVVNPASFGEDQDGELYLCCFDDRIYRLQETGGGGGGAFPQLLSDTGLFTDTAARVAAPGVIEYEVNQELWSDGARKRRWMALPGSARIAFDPTDAWSFPVGTVLVKHFEIDVAPGQTRPLETRVLLNHVSGWAGYTYRWNPQGSDADLLPGPASELLTILDPAAPGGQYDLVWNYPDRADCLVCHTFVAGRVLGLRTRQLNREFPFPARTDNQLRAWNHVGLFTAQLGPAVSYGALPGLGDPLASVELRARAYLDVNCAMCHRPGGPTPVDIDLLYDTPSGAMNAVGVSPQAGDVGLFNPFLITPFSKEDSVLWERMRLLDGNRMPPLGSVRLHDGGVDTVGQWIDDGAP